MIFTCFLLSAIAKPISVQEGVHYATGPAYSYTSSPLQTYAVPKVVAPIVSAQYVSAPIVQPVYHTPVYKHIEPEPYDPNPEYSYSYGVNDPSTGDNKHAQETLQNGVVQGSYSLSEPDGTVRKVTYTADKVNGFNAVVEKHGTPKYVTPLKYVAAAPVVSKYVSAAPIYQTPIAKYIAPSPIYHAPVAKYVAPVYHTPVAKYIASAPYHAPVAKYISPAAYHAPVYASYHGYH